MGKGKQQVKQDDRTTNLLISLLMRFPEIMSISFDMPKERCKFTFIMRGTVKRDEYAGFQKTLDESLAVYSDMTGENFGVKTKLTRSGKMSLLEASCKTGELSLEAIQLIIAVMDSIFTAKVVRDADTFADIGREDDIVRQEEIIEYLLSLSSATRKENLIAFREAGRVYVYDR